MFNDSVNEENNEAPAVEEAPVVEQTPVAEETPVVETPVVEEPVVEAPAVEEPKIDAIPAPSYEAPQEVPAVGPVANGAIGTTTAIRQPRASKKNSKSDEPVEKVAIHSTKNVTWQGVGKVYRGYNIVTKEAADQWLNRSHIRMATAEEVAKEFGK